MGIKVTTKGSVIQLGIEDSIITHPQQPFVHHHLSSNTSDSYYIYGGNQKIGIDISKPIGHSSFYLQIDKNGEVFFPSFSCTITHSQPPACETLPSQVEIFTNSGYWIYPGGVEICSDLCFERMKQSLGRYYALPQKILPPPVSIPVPSAISSNTREMPSYDVILQKLNSSDLGVKTEGIMDAGERKERQSVILLQKFLEDLNPHFEDLRPLAYASLAALPFSEASDLLMDHFSKVASGSSEASSLSLALSQIPRFLRSADRIAKLYAMKTKHPEEVGMILKAWGISMETPVPQEMIVQYGPLPNPPPHPVTIEWLADEIDNRLKKYPHLHRQSEGQYAMPFSVRDVIGLQGVLYPLTIFMQGLESKELRNAIGRYLETDFKDGMTEYGVYFTYEGNKVQAHLLAPARWGNNFEYQPPVVASHLPDTKGFLFLGHLHSMPSSEKYAGPSHMGHSFKGDLWDSDQLVITRLEKGKFNIDWYDHQYGMLDLGIYSYNSLAVSLPQK